MRLISTQCKMFSPDLVGGEATQQVVYQAKVTNEVKDTWKRRIIDLADGKSIGEILDTMFNEKIRADA